MKLLEMLRKGFGFVLMSMGVSRPAAKKPSTGNTAKKSAGQS